MSTEITPRSYAYAALAVSIEIGLIPGQPHIPIRSSPGNVVPIPRNSQSLTLVPHRSQTATFTMLLNGIDNTIDTVIISNIELGWVNEYHLVILYGGVLIDPI